MATDPEPGSVEVRPTIHAAERASGPSGVVEWGEELSVADALQRRLQGLDIVVRGPDGKENRRLAREIEEAIGPAVFDLPHARAGPHALPHYNQVTRSPGGHSFYDVGKRKARKMKP